MSEAMRLIHALSKDWRSGDDPLIRHALLQAISKRVLDKGGEWSTFSIGYL